MTVTPAARTSSGLARYLHRHAGCPHNTRDSRIHREKDHATDDATRVLPRLRGPPRVTLPLADYAAEACQNHGHKTAKDILECIAVKVREDLTNGDAELGNVHRPVPGQASQTRLPLEVPE